VQAITDAWLRTHNDHRPHDALGSLPVHAVSAAAHNPVGVCLRIVSLTGEPTDEGPHTLYEARKPAR